ncbi:MAG TPA: glycerophosphodiester phosphodiesterase family protein [Microlunatus sp.]|nr:glycerophosphodiester phosphodiesterase family protein [Microlunatus sp.]
MRAADYGYFDAPFLAFAHRGGATYPANLGRENTLHAFEQAAKLGYRYFETDVHATADGVLVAFHDDRLDRVTDRTGRVGELPYRELSRARIGGVDPIPTFDELLDAFPDVRFNVDAKSDAAVPLLADAIRRHRAAGRVCVSSFGVARLHRLRRLLGPETPTAASQAGIAWNRFAPRLTRLLNTGGAALQLPVRHRVAGREVTVLTPRLIEAVHRAGKQVHVWTVDDAEEIEALIERGVDGIFTDRIDILSNVLIRRGLWS